MAQRKAMKARLQADYKGLKHHSVYQKGVYLKIKTRDKRQQKKGYLRKRGKRYKRQFSKLGKGGRVFKAL